MKTLLEGLDLRSPNPSPGVETKISTAMLHAHNMTDHTDNLRKALVAALGVIDTMNADGVMKYAKAVKELETALEPFRKEPSDGR